MTSRLLTVREAAAMLGRSTGFVRALISEGMVAGQKVRGRWYVTATALEGWVRGGEVAPPPSRPVYVIPAEVKVRGRRAC